MGRGGYYPLILVHVICPLLQYTKKTCIIKEENRLQQGIDGSARKPALRQDTGYMVEKTYLDIAPYLGAFGAYVMPQ